MVANLQRASGGRRLQQVLWAASGSEAVQKALWAALDRDPSRQVILATRDGFHGKKGLAGATTGTESDPERDPRVRFISFPKDECRDVTLRDRPFDPLPYRRELDGLARELGGRLAALITEPYLGGAGSYHPPKAYLQLLEQYCREHDLIFILDEVQANFGRTGSMYAFETYGLEADIVILGKGLGNGVPVAAAAGPADVLGSLDFGDGSDTYSANPLAMAGVLATLDLFESRDIIGQARRLSAQIEQGLLRLKELPIVAHVRGEGVVWGVEMRDYAGRSASEVATAAVLQCYRGDETGRGIHLLGPLAGNVLRISPPLVMTESEARESLDLLYRLLERLALQLSTTPAGALAAR